MRLERARLFRRVPGLAPRHRRVTLQDRRVPTWDRRVLPDDRRVLSLHRRVSPLFTQTSLQAFCFHHINTYTSNFNHMLHHRRRHRCVNTPVSYQLPVLNLHLSKSSPSEGYDTLVTDKLLCTGRLI